MKSTINIISERITNAIEKATGIKNANPIVTVATDARFGDYQSNAALPIAKQLKTNPRQLAEKIIGELKIDDICEKPEIAGPGFINLRLKPAFVAAGLMEIKADTENLGIEKTEKPKTVVVDFSGPNIAKQMHVGHLRSTIIGDCVCRMLKAAGHNVIPQNHIGDWGTQFGMLCALLNKKTKEGGLNSEKSLEDLEAFYKEAKIKYDSDEKFTKTARDAIAGLHRGEKNWIEEWKNIVAESRKHYLPIYDRLKADLTADDERGESFYKDMLAGIVEDLKKAGLAEESDGAICVFPDKEKFKNKDGDPLPFIIQKSDGAFLYATTDLAALRYRVEKVGADEIIYVTDARQKLHFEMLFATACKAGWVSDDITLKHVTFGSVLGEDGKPFKTRSGENVKLSDLLDEAVSRAKTVVEEKNPELDQTEKAKIAEAVGIGAVKYADYSNNRTSDYVFSFDKMLAMEGNTAPYMQYAYARVKSIGKKAEQKGIDVKKEIAAITKPVFETEAELNLAKYLIRFNQAIESGLVDLKPNLITTYLYELAQKFSSFYNACPVLDSQGQSRASRLLLCEMTAATIKNGLENLLGIKTIDRM